MTISHPPGVAMQICLALSIPLLPLLTACGVAGPEESAGEKPDVADLPVAGRAIVKRVRPTAGDSVGQAKQALGFSGECTNQQKRVMETTHGWLRDYVDDATWRLQTGVAEQRRNAYFNPQTDEQRSTIYYRVDDMQWTLENNEFSYHCYAEPVGDCFFGAVALAGSGHNIILCPSFWDYDNQERLIVLSHELAHYAGAEDYYYDGYDDWTSSFLFIQYSPATAVLNANNYALFVMNPWGIPN